ncbi:MAG TPA: TIGR03557 family F420-dependent LLM class oxidoreductase [Streptosporangiaceae bacterium]|jgi:G6PDH family F420-dependent oxidoreductase
MTQFGYTAMCEQTPVRQLVGDLVAAEEAGFDFSVMSDHYFPWIEDQGHSGYAWSILGAAAQATHRLPLMTFVTCPSFRYHPAVVAQKAATMGVLSGGRFTLGLGAGENLNEHVIGSGWPSARMRQERLSEAVEIIRRLMSGDYVSFSGRHYSVERAKLYDLPDTPVPIGIAVSGPGSVRLAAEHADCMISTEPEASLIERFEQAGGSGKPKYGQVPLCYDRDENAARARAVKLWRWAVPGWHVMSELPEPRSFEAAAATVTEDDIGELVPSGPDTGRHVQAVQKFIDAGFTHVALVGVGAGQQDEFLSWAAGELLPALRKLN